MAPRVAALRNDDTAARRAAAPRMGLAARVAMSAGALAARPRLLTAASLMVVVALVTIARSSFKFTEVMLPALKKKDAPPEQGRGVVAAEAEAAAIISEAVAELVAESTPEPTPEPELAVVATTPAAAPAAPAPAKATETPAKATETLYASPQETIAGLLIGGLAVAVMGKVALAKAGVAALLAL